MHINETVDLPQNPLFKEVHFKSSNFFDSEEKIKYWRDHSPIFCRDEHTVNIFRRFNIPAYFSGCLTLSLNRTIFTREPDLYIIVDSHILEKDLLEKLVPQSIRKKAIYTTHSIPTRLSTQTKLKEAQNLLELYQKAKCVITSRLHCALPSVSYGVPVVFLYSQIDNDVRFDETYKKLLGNGKSLPKDWDWNNPKLSQEVIELIKDLKQKQKEIIMKYL